MTELQKRLFALQDTGYRDFQMKLIPTVPADRAIGVRTPELRKLAKDLRKQESDLAEAFLGDLPHTYFDENQLHAFLISLEKDYGTCIAQVNAFLPYVDNWATCDALRPKAVKKKLADFRGRIDGYLASAAPYTVRFGIEMLMCHYLDAAFSAGQNEQVASIRSEQPTFLPCAMT